MRLVIALVVLSLLLQSCQSRFDTWTGKIDCSSLGDCLHERGHCLDWISGWPSRSDDFQSALDTYRWLVWEYPEARDSFSELVMFFPGIGNPKPRETNPLNLAFWQDTSKQELYASLFQQSGGDPGLMPSGFSRFFDLTKGDTRCLYQPGYQQ